jgi:hypothetical protein
MAHPTVFVFSGTWVRLRFCASHFCVYDDYNWDWTLAVRLMEFVYPSWCFSLSVWCFPIFFALFLKLSRMRMVTDKIFAN